MDVFKGKIGIITHVIEKDLDKYEENRYSVHIDDHPHDLDFPEYLLIEV